MDLWVFVTAAGAGYLAKFWQNHWKKKDSSRGFSNEDSNHETHGPGTHPSSRKAWRKKPGKVTGAESRDANDCGVSSTSWLESDSREKVSSINASTFGCHNLEPEVLIQEHNIENGEERNRGRENKDVNYSVLLPDMFPGEIGSLHGFSRTRRSLKTKGSLGHFVKPLNSLDSCLLAQLYKEHSEMEEYVFSSFSSPHMPRTRTLVVSNGNQVISRGSDSSYVAADNSKHFQNELCQVFHEAPSAVPSMPKILELPKRVKCKSGRGQSGRLAKSGKTIHEGCSHSQNGTASSPFLHFLLT